MARIRSLHPGQWTDEAFVSVSPTARLLALALRNEADDEGVFEWKPITLKMRLMPADNVDVGALLEELAAADQVKRYELEGRQYGAIRNFTRWQRPKKPKSTHPKTVEVRNYVGINGAEFPTGTEISPQRKEVGGSNPPIDPPPKRKPQIPIPDNWQPSPDMVMRAAEKYPDLDISHETDRFISDALAKDRRNVNWNQAWWKWLASPYAGKRSVNGPQDPDAREREGARRVQSA